MIQPVPTTRPVQPTSACGPSAVRGISEGRVGCGMWGVGCGMWGPARLEAVGVRDGDEAARDGVQPDRRRCDPDPRDRVEAEDERDDTAGADEVAAEEAAERDDREDGEERLGGGAELAREEVGEREQPHLVQRLGEEDAVEDEREAEAEREARAVPPVVLVPQVDVAERGVRVERLRGERRSHNEDVERATCGGRGGTGGEEEEDACGP